MPIRFQCPVCQSTMNSPDIMAGRTLQCPNCWEKIDVPSQARLPAPTPETEPQDCGSGLDQTPEATERTVTHERFGSKRPAASGHLGNRLARWFAGLFKGGKAVKASKKKRRKDR
jgi:hypothetical protein